MSYNGRVIFGFVLVIINCVYVYSGSFTGKQLTKHIKYFEGINYSIDDVAQQHSRVARSSGNREKHVDIKFYSHDRYFHLRLRRDTSVFMQDFVIETSEGEIPHVVQNTYAGEIVDELGSYCHGTITNGTLSGRIYSKDEAYTLDPAKLYFDNSDFHSVLYADKHVDKDSLTESGCGLVGEIQKRMQEKLKKKQGQHQEPVVENASSKGKSRQRRQNSKQQTCPLFIQADHFFYKKFGSREAVLSYIAEHVQAASYLYSNTDFGIFTDINFAVSRFRVWTAADKTNSNYKFAQEFIGVEKFLDLASEGDWSQYCASYTFTDRDFSNGVLGLAWIASDKSNSDGGICSKYSRSEAGSTLNSGIVTINNYGSFVPPAVSHLTFAHELGHSFGSGHDPDTVECTPGGSEGNYLMFSHASSADKTNNVKFSICSIQVITDVLNSLYVKTSKDNWCFVEESELTSCGNGIVETGEQCDCGYEPCEDKCCYAQTEEHSANACTLRMGECSPTQGTCCNEDTCMYKTSGSECVAQGDCNAAAQCPGDNSACPTPAPINNGALCHNNQLLCYDGTCSLSICGLGQNLEQCQCTGEKAALCQVCCQIPNQPQTCIPSYRINIPKGVNTATNLSVGSPCNNYMGYCDIFNECRLANEDGPLSSIIRRIFFSDEPEIIEAINDWLRNMWWVVVIIIICLIVIMTLTVIICNRIIPTSNPFKVEKEKLKKDKNSSITFRGRQNRNTQYGRHRTPDANVDDHPDARVESRATSF